MAGTRIRWKRNKIERRKSGSIIEIEVTEQYKEDEIILRCNTISGKIPTVTFGKNWQTQKKVEKNWTMEMGHWQRFRPVFDKLPTLWGLVFVDDKIAVLIDPRRRLMDIIHLGLLLKLLSDAKILSSPQVRTLNIKFQKTQHGKLGKLTEPGQEPRIDSTGKLHSENLYWEPQITIALDRFSEVPTAKICKTAKTKEVLSFLTNLFNFYGIPEGINWKTPTKVSNYMILKQGVL